MVLGIPDCLLGLVLVNDITGDFSDYADKLEAILAARNKDSPWRNNEPNINRVVGYLRELKIPVNEKRGKVLDLLKELLDTDELFNLAEKSYLEKKYEPAGIKLANCQKAYFDIGLGVPVHVKELNWYLTWAIYNHAPGKAGQA